MSKIQTKDKYNLRGVILNYLNLLSDAQKIADKVDLKKLSRKKFSNLIICGMGGSALAGDFLIQYLNHDGSRNLPIYICRSYDLPEDASSKSLVFIFSYSGNTEETVSCFGEALKLGAEVVAFASGGKVKETAQKNKVQFVELDFKGEHFEPRYGAPIVFATMHQILAKLGLCKKIKKFPEINAQKSELRGKKMAQKIKGRTPVIYASDKYDLLAKNWKIKINENSKTPAFWNFFPELNHNEMVGFTNPQGKFCVIMLLEKDDNRRNKKRMEITARLYKKKGIEVDIIKIEGKTFLEKIFRTLVLGDWVSYYLALEYGQDPTPVEMVEELKVALTK